MSNSGVRLLLIDNYDSFTYNLVQAFLILGAEVDVRRNDEITVEAGHIVVVPAETPHMFKCAGDDTLRVVSVHPSGTLQQTDL